MRKIYFLFPRMNINSGGHLAQIKLFELTTTICTARPVTYEVQEDDILFLDHLLEAEDTNDDIFIVHWGPHITDLIQRLAGKNIVYASYSTGYDFAIPPGVPIIASSKHTQAYWGRYSPSSPIFYLPCEISEEFKNLHLPRDIDVFVQKRKSSRYLLEELVPALRPYCSVTVLDSWVDDLTEVFNRSKVYLYDSTEHWIQHGTSEGFGLPPLEALACGCTVFSSINDALSDHLDPGFNCHQLRIYSKEYDLARILKAVREWKDDYQENDPVEEYRGSSILKRLRLILIQINEFLDQKQQYRNDIEDIGVLPSKAEIRLIKERIQKMENSRGWRLLERLRGIHARVLQALK